MYIFLLFLNVNSKNKIAIFGGHILIVGFQKLSPLKNLLVMDSFARILKLLVCKVLSFSICEKHVKDENGEGFE